MIALLLLPLLAIAALAAPATTDSPPLTESESIKEGTQLIAELRAQRPAENSSAAAVLKLRGADGERTEIPVRLRTEIVDPATWRAIYEANPSGQQSTEKLVVTRRVNGANDYSLSRGDGDAAALDGTKIFQPFAGSDFSAADLGLEFLHWPTQKVLKHEMRRGRPCKLMESSTPKPSAGAYARVLSWVDTETGGLIRAEAYDANRKLVKEFSLKSFKKVDGRWQLQEMEMISHPQDSRTRLEFDLTVDAAKAAP